MDTELIFPLDRKSLPESVGSKARNLRLLSEKGFRVPKSFACTWEAYLSYLQNDSSVIARLKEQLGSTLNPDGIYAVRSSANIEDSLDYSFAGQFKTVLEVQGVEPVMEAIQEVWQAARSEAIQSYLSRIGIDPEELRMGVIVQEMVKPVLSGVAFSKNPITAFDEVIIEVVPGSGVMLVQEGVTPQRWVNKRGVWIEKSETEDSHQALLLHVVDQTRAISKAFKLDVDLEWVYDGIDLYWLQMREITSLCQQRTYSNKIAKDMLPGLIKPLIWSVNTPIVNGTWVDILTELIGENDIDPVSLTRAFYYRTYFDMTTFGRIFESLGLPAESLEMMMGVQASGQKMPKFKPNARMIALLPRLLRFAFDKWNFSRYIDRDLPKIDAGFKKNAAMRADLQDNHSILQQIEELKILTRHAAYLNIVGPLLMSLYNGMLRKQLQQLGVDYEKFDLMAGIESIHQYDPHFHLQKLNNQFHQLDPDIQERIQQSSYAEFQALPEIHEFQENVSEFIEQFGHLSDSGNDFSSIPWRENPDLILHMITTYIQPEEKTDSRLKFDQLHIHGIRRLRMARIYERARWYRLYREQISSMYTFGYGLFRDYYLALGDSLVRDGVMAEREDIFYLYEKEVLTILRGETGTTDYAALVQQRKQEMEQYRHVDLPDLIYGDQPPPVQVAARQVLRGTPTSRGYYTGPVKNVCGINDFPKVEEGDVLVVPYSDVGWTPLFAKAGAVIAESGGILSHSSIIAREYNIPAVVSVPGALQLSDNTLVTIDGYKGEILVHSG